MVNEIIKYMGEDEKWGWEGNRKWGNHVLEAWGGKVEGKWNI